AQAASVARQRQLKGGTLAVNGVGSWSAQMFSSDGKFDLQGLAWQDSNLVARDVSASGKFAIDPQKLSISQAEGELVHGRFVADAEVSNWQSRVKQAGAKNAQAGIVKVKFRDLSLAEVLASLGPAFRPFNRLKFAGNVSGTTDLRWRWSVENAEATFALDVTRPNRLQPGQIPVTGSTHANYSLRLGSFAVSDLAANTPATQVHASGELSSSSSLRFSFATTDLREWQPLTNDMFPTGLPFSIRGRAAFNGTASGKLASMAVAGNLQVEDFDVAV